MSTLRTIRLAERLLFQLGVDPFDETIVVENMAAFCKSDIAIVLKFIHTYGAGVFVVGFLRIQLELLPRACLVLLSQDLGDSLLEKVLLLNFFNFPHLSVGLWLILHLNLLLLSQILFDS